MALLIPAVARGMIVLRACAEAGGGLRLVLTVHGSYGAGRLERSLEAAVLGGHVLSAEMGRRLGIGSQIRVMALLVSPIIGSMVLLGLIHFEILL